MFASELARGLARFGGVIVALALGEPEFFGTWARIWVFIKGVGIAFTMWGAFGAMFGLFAWKNAQGAITNGLAIAVLVIGFPFALIAAIGIAIMLVVMAVMTFLYMVALVFLLKFAQFQMENPYVPSASSSTSGGTTTHYDVNGNAVGYTSADGKQYDANWRQVGYDVDGVTYNMDGSLNNYKIGDNKYNGQHQKYGYNVGDDKYDNEGRKTGYKIKK